MNEQCRSWTCRSRCCTKSEVDTAANSRPSVAPTRTTTNQGEGHMKAYRPMMHASGAVLVRQDDLGWLRGHDHCLRSSHANLYRVGIHVRRALNRRADRSRHLG